jgi:hypothetical protein
VAPPPPAPTPVRGGLQPNESLANPLDSPLATKQEVLVRALQIDATRAVWDQPWYTKMLDDGSGRVTVELYTSRSQESRAAGRNEEFAPELDANAGSVWRVTINGTVRLAMLEGLSAASTEASYDGVTYVISQRTGELLEVISGHEK